MFTKDKTYLIIDFETRSKADLPSVGQTIYALHGSTEILCIGWTVFGSGVYNVVPYEDVYLESFASEPFIEAVRNADYLVAHNAPFEQAIFNRVLCTTTALANHIEPTTPDRWLCTLSMSNILSLPRSLEGVGNALGLPIKKNVEARKLMLKMCKPRKPILNVKKWLEWVQDDESLLNLYEYCRTDLKAEELALKYFLNYPIFTPTEREVWVLDQIINQRGFSIDEALVKKCITSLDYEQKKMTLELSKLTGGKVKSGKSPKALKDWLETNGISLENTQKATIEKALKGDELPNHVKKVLELRQSLSLSSVSKYQAFSDRVAFDGKVRDNLMYHGASTGRFSGMGVQPQNFPRGKVKMNEHIIEDIKNLDAETFAMLYPSFDVYSSALRSVIVAPEGEELFCADASSIEARGVLWLAGDKAGLKEYFEGLDVYVSMASTTFNRPYEEIMAEYKANDFSEARHVGKTAILGCGYQMGEKKFLETARASGSKSPDYVLIRAHKAFREKYPLVPQVWTNYERAAIMATMNPGKRYTINKVTWFVDRDFLFARLPSGRRLAYYKPSIRNEQTPWGDTRPKLYHWSVDPKTKQWSEAATYGGKLTENICQALCRDIIVNSMFATEAAGFKTVLTVHDEILSTHKKGQKTKEEFIELLSKPPQWALDFPLKWGGWSGQRYRK